MVLFDDYAVCMLQTHSLNLIMSNDALDAGMFTCTVKIATPSVHNEQLT
jgi:hypothetical protein